MKKGQNIWTDISLKINKWLIRTWKDANHLSSEKCKFKPQWDTITLLTRLAKTEGMTVSNAGKDLKQLELSIQDCQKCKNDKTT